MPKKGSSAESQLGLPEYRGHSTAEKVALAALVLFVLAAMAGAFGDGPLSQASATSSDGQVRIEYQRFCRRHSPQLLDITLPTQAGADRAELRVDAEYLHRVQITEIFPAPLESTHHRTGVLRFTTDGSGEPMTVRVHLEAQHAGVQEAHVTVGAAVVRFKQIVYP